MRIQTIFLIAVGSLFLLTSAFAENIKYFSLDGKEISKIEYNNLSADHIKRVEKEKRIRIEQILSKTDTNGRPKYRLVNGEITEVNYLTAGYLNKYQNREQHINAINLDKEKRPEYDEQGRRIIYADEEKIMRATKWVPGFGRVKRGAIIGVMDTSGNTVWERRVK